jgi:hypothetical protein
MAGFRQIKGSRTPADAGVRCPRASGVRDAPRSKAACAALRLRARSPAGIPLTVFANRTFVPRAQLRARLPERRHKRSGHSRTRRLFGHSDAPRAPVVLPAGMMPEPPGSGVYLSTRGCRTRSAIRKYPPKRRPLMSEIDCRYYQRRGEVKRRRIFFDESGRLHGACLLRRHSTPMILWRPIFVIAGLDPAIHAASRIHHGPPGQARW